MDPGFLLDLSKSHPSLLGTKPALQCRALSSRASLCGVWTWYLMFLRWVNPTLQPLHPSCPLTSPGHGMR